MLAGERVSAGRHLPFCAAAPFANSKAFRSGGSGSDLVVNALNS